MAEANSDSGRMVMGTPISAGIIVIASVGLLVALHRIVIKIH